MDKIPVIVALFALDFNLINVICLPSTPTCLAILMGVLGFGINFFLIKLLFWDQ